ncbi:hypothetical protein [Poriferisphaera sp. WC338]|uniref:hypothetical protein n=1 Tax=Poriferisphaera sp. WC338 TaxID=3425129 RepID=UPI003D81452F
MKSKWTDNDARQQAIHGESNTNAPNLRLVGGDESAQDHSREVLIQRGIEQLRKLRQQTATRQVKDVNGQTVGQRKKFEGISTPISGADDARWVFAVRVSESMQGSMIDPSKREKLIKLGKVMGLNAFDCNLIIAMLQDQARRGNMPAYCPHLAQKQLEMITPAGRHRHLQITSNRKQPYSKRTVTLGISVIIAGAILLMEVCLMLLFVR